MLPAAVTPGSLGIRKILNPNPWVRGEQEAAFKGSASTGAGHARITPRADGWADLVAAKGVPVGRHAPWVDCHRRKVRPQQQRNLPPRHPRRGTPQTFLNRAAPLEVSCSEVAAASQHGFCRAFARAQ